MEWTRVKGHHKSDVRLYALSTCGHCKRTKDLLNELGIDYSFLFVDLLSEKEISLVLTDIEKFNPRGSFPTLVIDNGKRCIVGFHEEEIREALS
ncbi:MAG: glutaredoxin family protein [Methanospirillaceae archaeon]|nr:glutaredoxin family protein [Methanospirillaceae archaeon]